MQPVADRPLRIPKTTSSAEKCRERGNLASSIELSIEAPTTLLGPLSSFFVAMNVFPSLAPFVLKRPWLKKMLVPVADMYAQHAGYRQMGLR